MNCQIKFDSTDLLLFIYILADVAQPILGADFLRSNSLLVDLRGNRLIDAATYASVPIVPSTGRTFTPAPHLYTILDSDNVFTRLLAAHPDLTTPTFSHVSPKHGVQHHILTEGPPVHGRARRLPPDELAAMKAEFNAMEKLGIIRRSNSQWASPLHAVPSQMVVGDLAGITAVSMT